MADYDLVIKGGIVVDGARNPRVRADVGVRDGRIARIGRIPAGEGRRVLDAAGMIVAPGYIDVHTHYDAQVFWDPYMTTSGWHGVTSVVTGNCGFGFAPVHPDMRDRSMLTMTAVEQIPVETLREGMPWDWVSFPDYLDSVERTPKAVNLLPYVALNPLLVWVLGLEAAKAGVKPTDEQHAEIARLFDEAMSAGACGWSAQCLGQPGQPVAEQVQGDFDGSSMPSDVMWPETRLVLADVMARRGDGFIQLSGGATIAREHFEELVERSGRPLLWQALVPNTRSAGFHLSVMEWLRDCQRRGLPIYGQGMTTDPVVPFTFEYGAIYESGPWRAVAEAASTAERIRVLSDPGVRPALREFVSFAFSRYGDLVIHRTFRADNAKWQGRTVGDLATAEGKDPLDAMLDLAIAEELRTVFHGRQFEMTLDGLKTLVDDEYVLPGLSDGGAHLRFLSAGMYGTEYIANYVREHGFTTLEQAHYRLSGLPAHCAGFRDRGVLREGAAADIVVYDYDRLAYLDPEFAFDLPGGKMRTVIGARGYRYVLVNGRVTIEDDRETGDTTAGQLLRGGTGAAAR